MMKLLVIVVTVENLMVSSQYVVNLDYLHFWNSNFSKFTCTSIYYFSVQFGYGDSEVLLTQNMTSLLPPLILTLKTFDRRELFVAETLLLSWVSITTL